MRWTLVNKVIEMDYGLKEMNKMGYVWKKLRWNNAINERNGNVTREELMSSNYVMIGCKSITEQ